MCHAGPGAGDCKPSHATIFFARDYFLTWDSINARMLTLGRIRYFHLWSVALIPARFGSVVPWRRGPLQPETANAAIKTIKAKWRIVDA